MNSNFNTFVPQDFTKIDYNVTEKQYIGTRDKTQNPMSILNKTQDRVFPVNMHFSQMDNYDKTPLKMEDLEEQRQGLKTSGNTRIGKRTGSLLQPNCEDKTAKS